MPEGVAAASCLFPAKAEAFCLSKCVSLAWGKKMWEAPEAEAPAEETAMQVDEPKDCMSTSQECKSRLRKTCNWGQSYC
eukprot:4933802-Amphidinium_carterae.1